jgi:bacillithiol biosynthesis deacetylase BshB1
MKQTDILAIGVHPDDVELSCSGTLLAQQALGRSCAILDLTKGELGTRGNAALRTQEALASSAVLGIDTRIQLDLADGFFGHSREEMIKIVEVIRLLRPRVVLANAIQDRHPDHGRAATLVADACFLSGLPKIDTTFNGQAQQAYRPQQVYHYIQDYTIKPDLVIDITPYLPKKLEAILAFSSQFFDPKSTEPATPISGKEFFESVIAKNRVFGRYIGVEFAEGYTASRPMGVTDLLDLI